MTNQDSHLERTASNEAKQIEIGIPEVQDTQSGQFVVTVRDLAPELGTAQMVVLNANNTVREILPRDPNRRSAIVLAVDNDVFICSSREVASNVAGTTTATFGFYLPKGIVIPVANRGAFWAAATTTASNSRVSVLVNKDNE